MSLYSISFLQENKESFGVEILHEVYVLAEEFILRTEKLYMDKMGPAYSGRTWEYWCARCRAIYPSHSFCRNWVRSITGLQFKREITSEAIERINCELAAAHPNYAEFLYVDRSVIVPGELGLFTLIDLGKSSDRELLLGEYQGEVHSRDIANNPSSPSDYRMDYGADFKDAMYYLSGYFRYSNDGLLRGNSIYIDENTHPRYGITLYVRVFQDVEIKARSELTLSYGLPYWLDALKYPNLIPASLVADIRKCYNIIDK